ncbi:hypothetical protein PU634_16785 [Oceanimonas pelagia]|uniref:Uncharacterized protein n=1 Tax=Oceanimonas pelagia TaxID=3028314 RepID=A0AA50KP78_9GAMM|nr:hypothetical protein [Oceanimonas pelagia]WMC10701.1 hypothetical protein PU634_16785 [Oceanimonas pelagia]
MNPILYLPTAESWLDLTSLPGAGVDGIGVFGAIMMLEVLGNWLLSWTGLSADIFEYQAQLADLFPVEALKHLLCTSLLVFAPLLLQWLLLLLHLLLQHLNWPRMHHSRPALFTSPKPRRALLRAHSCRAPPMFSLGF